MDNEIYIRSTNEENEYVDSDIIFIISIADIQSLNILF